ncbi:MAG: hypothetical protein WC757_03080 [Candidatus Paceibacterota bacterium]|jgi:hypothetical protein
MTPKQFFMGRAIGFIILLLTVGGFFAFNTFIYNEKQGEAPTFEPYRGTLSGTTVCLPHKETAGPQTLECSFGLKTDAGEHYVLDYNLMSQTPPVDFQTGVRFSASGVITPIERLSTNQWKKYDVQGIFSVTMIDGQIVTPTPSMPATTTPTTPTKPVLGKCFVGGCSAQLCTDQPDMASDCMYREEYVCYQNATCERQFTGQCGWTETTELKACLDVGRPRF